MYNSQVPNPMAKLTAARITRIKTQLRALTESTLEAYQAQVYSAVNGVLNIAGQMQPLALIEAETPAIVGDVTTPMLNLTKPFAFGELLARLDALTRRAQGEGAQTKLEVGDLRVDLLTRKVTRGERSIVLQPREFKLLEYLMRHAEQVVTRTMLLENVWDYHFDPQTNVVDVHISKLRQKIDADFERPLLRTVRNAGYTMTAHD